ncbi:MAG: helix-hairpin-helix domain-containing protein [Candidatus Cloacimonadaceae bacterium]|nr:helix-hairpin-helix domain-containing protein [Candidatus Cloacimonadota bacterium]
MKKLFLMFLALIFIGLLSAKVDLNTAGMSELKQLPISEAQARDIYEYRTFVKIFDSIYDLREIPSIDQRTMNKLKPLVVVSVYTETDDVTLRREEISDLIERLDSNEGASEGMADVWEDYLMTPQNVNRMHFNDFVSLPNVSAVDAAAILKRVARGDTIADTRDLRGTMGLSYYGYTNLRNYVYFKEPPVKNRLMFDAQIQYYTRYFEEGQYDMLHEPFLPSDYGNNWLTIPQDKRKTYWGYFELDQVHPDITAKLRMRYGNNLKMGIMNYSPKAHDGWQYMDSEDFWNSSKYYAGYENTKIPWLDNTSLKMYLGHYRATYGEGLTMENTDFYSSRKTGFGFSKRIMGITPDLSKASQYALRGAAVELANPYFNASFFVSDDDKDGLAYINEDGSYVMRDEYGNDVFRDSDGKQYFMDGATARYTYDDGSAVSADKNKFFSYITPSLPYDNDTMMEAEAYMNSSLYPEVIPPGSAYIPYQMQYINLAARKDAIREKLWGTHLELSPIIGTRLGFTTYTALYEDAHFVVPGFNDLKNILLRDSYNIPKIEKAMNAEISNLYGTQTDRYSRDYRRVIGFDGGTVLGNTAIQGEYAEMSKYGEDTKLGDDPKAYLISSHTQFENLYFITLYRNYDIGFDNPYSNSFSEHERFNDTILEKNIYALSNPLISDMYQNSNQSQPEKGLYFETRYKFNRYFTVGRSYLDLWERLADGRRSARFQSELEFRPLYQLAMRLRYKNQVNRYDDTAERGVSKTNEYTVAIRTFLSNRDFLELEYRYNTVLSPPYTSLTYPAQPGNNTMAAAQTLMTGDYIGVNYTHNFTPSVKLQGSFLYWYGHGISHWDWEDMEIDFMGERGAKAWIAISSRISNNMYMNIKFRNKTYQDKEVRIRQFNNPADEALEGQLTYAERVEHSENTIRFSLDYRF